MAHQYNLQRGEHKTAKSPADFDPWTRIDAKRNRARDDDPVTSVERLARALCDGMAED